MTWGGDGDYGRWTTALRRWSGGLTALECDLPALVPEQFGTATWQRLVGHLGDALSARLQLWSRAFTADMATAGTAFGTGQAMSRARHGLVPIRALADHRGLPDDLRERLRDVVEQQVSSAQDDLERQVRQLLASGAPRAAVEERLRVVRGTPLTVAVEAPGGVSVPLTPALGGVPVDRSGAAVAPRRARRGRHILLD